MGWLCVCVSLGKRLGLGVMWLRLIGNVLGLVQVFALLSDLRVRFHSCMLGEWWGFVGWVVCHVLLVHLGLCLWVYVSGWVVCVGGCRNGLGYLLVR